MHRSFFLVLCAAVQEEVCAEGADDGVCMLQLRGKQALVAAQGWRPAHGVQLPPGYTALDCDGAFGETGAAGPSGFCAQAGATTTDGCSAACERRGRKQAGFERKCPPGSSSGCAFTCVCMEHGDLSSKQYLCSDYLPPPQVVEARGTLVAQMREDGTLTDDAWIPTRIVTERSSYKVTSKVAVTGGATIDGTADGSEFTGSLTECKDRCDQIAGCKGLFSRPEGSQNKCTFYRSEIRTVSVQSMGKKAKQYKVLELEGLHAPESCANGFVAACAGASTAAAATTHAEEEEEDATPAQRTCEDKDTCPLSAPLSKKDKKKCRKGEVAFKCKKTCGLCSTLLAQPPKPVPL